MAAKTAQSRRNPPRLTARLAPKPQVDPHRRLLPEVLIFDSEAPLWEVTIRVDFDGSVVTFRVAPRLGREEARLKARELDSMPLYLYAREAFRVARSEVVKYAPDATSEPEARAEFDILEGQMKLRKPGRRGQPDTYYARVASRYEWYCYESDSPTPTKDFASELHLSGSQVRGLLGEARRRRLLTDPPIKGKAGGHLTEKARALLNTTEES